MSTAKSRFSVTDVRVMVRDLRDVLVGQRVSNVYDLSNKTYLIKFAIPGKAEKDMLLLESGVRFHTTNFSHDKTDMPNVFARKLRSAIRQKRLEGIRQLGSDRVVDFKFGSGDAVAHIILELYSSGNIVLTDGSFEIVAALRTHEFEEGVKVNVGEIYPVSHTTTLGDNYSENAVLTKSPSEFLEWIMLMDKQYTDTNAVNIAIKKGGKIKKLVLRHMLLMKESGVSALGPEIIDHCLHAAGLNPTAKVCDIFDTVTAEESARSEILEKAERLLKELNGGVKLLELFEGPSSPGFIITKQQQVPVRKTSVVTIAPTQEDANDPDSPKTTEEYIDFIPYLFEQHKANSCIKSFPSFTAAVDEYFCKLEEQRLVHAAQSAEEAAHKRVQKTIEDQAKMLKALSETQSRLEAEASSIEACSVEVEKVRLVINSALSNRLSWDDINDMVVAETAAGNPIASLVKKLDLGNNSVILKLPNGLYVSPDEKGISACPTLDIAVDLAESAFNNARSRYQDRAAAKRKEEKAASQSEYVIQKVRDQAMKGLESQKLKRSLLATRKIHWFEKFNWFISSDGYLVLSGRDINQSDILVKRYLRAGDVYVHADLNGAVPCIIRNRNFTNYKALTTNVSGDDVDAHGDLQLDGVGSIASVPRGSDCRSVRPITPIALQEAGLSVVCRSTAWNAKIVISAWWVPGEAVSKSDSHGNELPTGSFAVYAKKNFLPPMSLEMGFGILFRVDAASAERHAKTDQKKSFDIDEETISLISEASDRYGLDMGFTLASEGPVPAFSRDNSTRAATAPASAAATALASLQLSSRRAGAGFSTPVTPSNLPSSETRLKEAVAADSVSTSSDATSADHPNALSARKKAATKKKNKKYAHQDEEDYELAMMALGLNKAKTEQPKDTKQQKKQKDIAKRQEDVGIGLLKEDWETVLKPLSGEVLLLWNQLVEDKLIKQGDFESFETNKLAAFPSHIGCSILADFKSELATRVVTNKSGFLSGIMRRYAKIYTPTPGNTGSTASDDGGAPTPNTGDISASRVPKPNALLSNFDMEDDEDAVDDFQNDFASLVSNPTPEDTVLYALPMCGPYSTFKNFKYKMKLTPGTLKKGKVAKQAQELFVLFKECTAREKQVIDAMNKAEITAAVLGDVKISMPGLQSVQRQQKKANDSGKKSVPPVSKAQSGVAKGKQAQQPQKSTGKKKK